METKSIERLQLLHPKIRDKAIEAYYEACKATPVGVHPFITQTYRSFEESENMYQQGRTTPGDIISNSKAGQSYHNYSLALDFCLQINGQTSWNVDANWMTVVRIFKAHGFGWGGDWKAFKDRPHFDFTFGYHWKDLLKKYQAKDFIPGTKYLNI